MAHINNRYVRYVDICCNCRYIKVAELEHCWRHNDDSFVIPDCESEVCLPFPGIRAEAQRAKDSIESMLCCLKAGMQNSCAILLAAVHAAVPDALQAGHR